MPRAFILLLDSFGIGATEDASLFGDANADTFGHIFEACAKGQANRPNGRQGPLKIPNLTQLGLLQAAAESTNKQLLKNNKISNTFHGAYGYAVERSTGKDTPSGHWEIAGVPVLFQWGYFPPTYPSFPERLIKEFLEATQLPGILGNNHASGTEIIQSLGEEHLKTGKPIVYTSADSVMQIAAHETYFGLQKLYNICEIARKLVDAYNIGRVIARPFSGEVGNFYRTANRRDLATPPPAPTLLDNLVSYGREVIGIGKIADIFAHRGITQNLKADGNMALFDTLIETTKQAQDGSLTFVNFVDFDMLYGHRRDVIGYAEALEALDARLPEFQELMQEDDIAIITADHGCDPTLPGSNHTREHIPVLLFGPKIKPRSLGRRETFADIGQSIASHLGIPPLEEGMSFLPSCYQPNY